MSLERLKEITDELLDRDFMLKQKKIILESLLESSPVRILIWMTDKDLTFIDSGDLGKLTSTGLESNSDYNGMTVYDFFKTSDPNTEPINLILRVLEGDTVTYWIDIEERTLFNKCSPIFDYENNIIGVMGITWDLDGTRNKLHDQ